MKSKAGHSVGRSLPKQTPKIERKKFSSKINKNWKYFIKETQTIKDYHVLQNVRATYNNNGASI